MDVVVGERIVTPLSLINLIVKLRFPRGSSTENGSFTLTGGGKKPEQEFLMSKEGAEDISPDNIGKAFVAIHEETFVVGHLGRHQGE